MRAFFFDIVYPQIRINPDSRQPHVVFPDNEYPGDRGEWMDGYKTYADEWVLADCQLEERSRMELNSFFHGFITAYWAEMMAADVPDELPNHGKERPVMDGLRMITGDSDDNLPTPGALCPYEDEAKREAWLAGYRGDERSGVDSEAFEQGVKAWEGLHKSPSEQPVPAGG